MRSRKLISVLALGAALLGPLAAATAAKAAPVTACDKGCTASFAFRGASETFTVPGGVRSLAFSVRGAAGGTSAQFGMPGGLGATVAGSLPVTPGETLTVLVGQHGSGAGGPTFGGGGSAAGATEYLASGGGGSFLFAPDGALLAAAGGGGGGGDGDVFDPNSSGEPAGYGGAGAGAGSTGGSGSGIGYHNEVPPSGGTPTSGGLGGWTPGMQGGDGTGPAADGAPGVGGDGVGDEVYRGGGGGGGLFGGGGGGYAQSGAGGSGYAAPTVTNLVSQDGVQRGNGAVSLGWSRSASDVTLATSPDGGSLQNDEVTVTATASGRGGIPTGRITFLSDGAGIDGCADQPLVDGAATCTTTALPPATHALSATYSGDLASAPATSSSSDYVVRYLPLRVTTTALPPGTVGTPYSESLAAAAGKAPYKWRVTSGALPTGLTLSTAGTLSGTPTHASNFTEFTATATDSQGTPYTATGDLSVSIAKAATISKVHVTHATVSATITASAPGGGSPGGTVSFAVAGTPVGTAEVLNGVATLAYIVPSGRTQQVAATYSGDDDFLASSASTARRDPSITATVTGAPAHTGAGWYRGNVTVRFTCRTAAAPLTTACPKPVTFGREGASQTVTRTVLAADGGADTVTVDGIAIDHTAPSVSLSGARNGAVYRGTAPRARCAAGDRLAGVATCTLTQTATPIAGGRVIHYRVTATDRAGNRRTATGSYTVLKR